MLAVEPTLGKPLGLLNLARERVTDPLAAVLDVREVAVICAEVLRKQLEHPLVRQVCVSHLEAMEQGEEIL